MVYVTNGIMLIVVKRLVYRVGDAWSQLMTNDPDDNFETTCY